MRFEYEELTWKEDANCKGLTHLFFPPRSEHKNAARRRERSAQLVCSACVVQIECQEFARNHHEFGFWGGENEDDRANARPVRIADPKRRA